MASKRDPDPSNGIADADHPERQQHIPGIVRPAALQQRHIAKENRTYRRSPQLVRVLPWQAPLFVAALGASSYSWAEATRDQQMESWLRGHVHAFEYFHGIPAVRMMEMVMGETINLKQFRKRAERERAAKQAETRRARFGRTRSERARDEAREKRASEHLNRHRLDGEDAS